MTISIGGITYHLLGADLQPARHGAPPRRQRHLNPGALTPHPLAARALVCPTFFPSHSWGGELDGPPTCASERFDLAALECAARQTQWVTPCFF